MCGILATSWPADSEKFRSALKRLHHRGPDDEGIFRNNDVCLGHKRLSILDLSEKGRQPLSYQNLQITYNGEIFNYVEIRKELESLGHVFKTGTDTEVVLAAFLEWGPDCLHKFNGMWAFIIYNEAANEFFISRDRFGIKPLFFTVLDTGIAFGSEMKALTPFLNEIKPDLEFDWCFQNIFDYESTEKCLINGIKRFPAGSYATLKLGERSINTKRFWNTMDHLIEVPESYEDQVLQFKELLFDSVRLRMRSDTRIGTALSGGVDSTAILSIMSHIHQNASDDTVNKDWQHAFVATFPGSAIDEKDLAKQAVDHLNLQATYKDIVVDSSVEDYSDYFYKFEEVYLTSPVPMFKIYETMKAAGVNVSLDGHGADEMLAGYGETMFVAFQDAGWNRKKMKNIYDTYFGIREGLDVGTSFRNKLRYNFNGHGGGRKALGYYARHAFKSAGKEQPEVGKLGKFNTDLYEMFHKTILPTLLRNYDRYSMGAGIETRMPFMDYRLVKYAFSLPWTSKLRNGYTKTILRDAVNDVSCPDINWRKPKIGFNSPIVDWLKGPWKEFFNDSVNSQDFKTCELIDAQLVKEKTVSFYQCHNPSFAEAEQLWTDFTPYFWQKFFLEKQ